MNSERLIRIDEVQDKTGLRRSSIYEQIRAGTFPEQVKLGPRAAAWYEGEITAWIASRRQVGRAA